MRVKYEAEIKDCTECDFSMYYDGWHCMLQKEGKEYPEDLPMNLRPCPIEVKDAD